MHSMCQAHVNCWVTQLKENFCLYELHRCEEKWNMNKANETISVNDKVLYKTEQSDKSVTGWVWGNDLKLKALKRAN